MSKEWAEQVAGAEAAALRKEAAEALAEQRFDAVHDEAQGQEGRAQAIKTDEFRQWIQARHETDAAWGAWATAMDAKPAG